MRASVLQSTITTFSILHSNDNVVVRYSFTRSRAVTITIKNLDWVRFANLIFVKSFAKMATKYSCSQVYVDFEDELGSGSFGTVYRGNFQGKVVAVKIIHGGEYGDSMKEIRKMTRAAGHANILKLLGTVPPELHRSGHCHRGSQDTPWLVMEYMNKGNLLEYIRDFPGGLSAYAMLRIAYQVARGMDHLHRSCNIIHMDLAARNVLVGDNDYHVKIGDFGLCRDYDYGDQYYEEHGYVFPIRWMPPENLYATDDEQRPVFSRKGDVWSYGVLLFEIWSRGKNPFQGLNNKEVIWRVKGGKTVLDYQNVNAKAWVMELMKKCFSFDKNDRPNFRMIYNEIWDNSDYDLND